MGRETRTALLLLAGGLVVALLSLFLQGIMLKSLPPDKRKLIGARAAQAAPSAPSASAAGAAPAPSGGKMTIICAEKLGACLAANGKDASTAKSLGDCYALCVKASGPCDQHSCGDLCEAAYGLRDDCR